LPLLKFQPSYVTNTDGFGIVWRYIAVSYGSHMKQITYAVSEGRVCETWWYI